MKRLLVFLLLLVMAGIASADIMPDGGFESGLWSGSYGYMWNAGTAWGWNTYTQASGGLSPGNYFGKFGLPASGYAYTYSYATASPAWQTWDGGWAAAWQQGLVANEGDILQASAYIKELNGTAGTGVAMLKIEAKDGSDNTLASHIEYFDVTADWAQVIGTTWEIPTGLPGYVGVSMVVGLDTADALGHLVGFDNVELNIVPEPITIGLLGLGGLFLRRRKA